MLAEEGRLLAVTCPNCDGTGKLTPPADSFEQPTASFEDPHVESSDPNHDPNED